MKKIAIIILALEALSFGRCVVGQLTYCHGEYGQYERRYVAYGGPQAKIREMLNDPCDGAEITLFVSYLQFKSAPPEESMFKVECGGVKYRITTDSLEYLEWDEHRTTEYGGKAKAAYRRAVKAAKFVTENSGKIGWTP